MEPVVAVEKIVIVGAGECGARAASVLRERDFSGSIHLVGAEPHHPYERPPLSKATLIDAGDPVPTTVADEAAMARRDIEFISDTTVTAIDRTAATVELDDGRSLPYDRLLLATGASARSLPIPGGEHALLLRTFDDARLLRRRLTAGGDPRRVVIVGAGFIGMEVAASARQLGCDVTVLEMAPRALARAVPAEIADVLVQRHVDEGVDIRFDVRTTGIERDGDGFRVFLAEGDEPLAADVVVAGVGASPNVALAAGAGLDCDNGIVVDAHLQTSDPAVYAAGDCCNARHELFDGRPIRLESWRNAYDQADVAAVNMIGDSEANTAVPWFWSDQYDLGLQLAGLFDAASTTCTRRRPDGVSVLFGLDDDRRLVAVAAVGTGAAVAKDVRAAEKMIAARSRPDVDDLVDPDTNLKTLLRNAR